jgi:hypothetical protein
MPAIKLDKFQGLIPRLTNKLLPDRNAQTAENLDLLSGRLQPLEEPNVVESAIGASQISAYLWRRNSSSEWLTWAYDVDVVKGPIADDDKERIYYIENGTMKVTGWDGAKETRNVGLSTPSAPTVAAAWRFDPGSQLDITSQTINTLWNGAASSSDTTSDETDDSYTYERIADNRIVVKFKFPAASYPQVSVALAGGGGISWYKSAVSWKVGVKADGSNWTWTTSYGSDIQGDSWTLSDGDGTYATLTIEKVTITGRYSNFNYDSGAVNETIDVDNSEYTLNLTLKLDYTAGDVSTGYRYYVQTFVDDWGEEGPASDISGIVEVLQGQKVTVTLPGATPAGENISHRRIYRSAAGTEEDEFFYVTQVVEATGSYVDGLADAELSEVMPQFKNPESGMAGLVVMPGGWMAAFKGKTLYFTAPWLPYTWPTQYELTFEWDIVAICPSENDLIVMTTGHPYVVTGSHPENLTQTKIMQNQACVAKRGVAQVGDRVLYPSPDGLVAVEGGEARLITEKFYRKEDWDALTPANLIAACYDKKYHGWSGANSIIFDFDEGLSAITTTDEQTTGVHQDIQDDALYLIQGTDIVEWRGGTDKLKLTWRSKEFQLSKCYDWKCCRIISDSYPIDGSGEELTLKLYANNSLVQTTEIFSEDIRMLQIMRPERIWSIQVESYNPIDEIIIATSVEALKRA